MPPEVFQIPSQFSDKVDIFSLGCVVIFTLTHQWPNPGPAKVTVGGKIVGLSEYERRKHYLVLFSERESELYLPLTISCLEEDPCNRPSSDNLTQRLLRITQEAKKSSTAETVSVNKLEIVVMRCCNLFNVLLTSNFHKPPRPPLVSSFDHQPSAELSVIFTF